MYVSPYSRFLGLTQDTSIVTASDIFDYASDVGLDLDITWTLLEYSVMVSPRPRYDPVLIGYQVVLIISLSPHDEYISALITTEDAATAATIQLTMNAYLLLNVIRFWTTL